MNGLKNLIFSIALLELFVVVTAFFPQYYSLMIIAYFVVFMGIAILIAGKSTRKVLKDLEYILDGDTLHEEEVSKLKNKDKEYLAEMQRQTRKALRGSLVMLLLIIFFISPLPRLFASEITRIVLPLLPPNQVLARFVEYQILYAFFFLLAVTVNRIYKPTPAPMTTIVAPSKYTITTRGLVADNTMPFRFPLVVRNYKVSTSRQYVELEVCQKLPSVPFSGERERYVKLRLYTRSPRDLWNLIKNYIKVEKPAQ